MREEFVIHKGICNQKIAMTFGGLRENHQNLNGTDALNATRLT